GVKIVCWRNREAYRKGKETVHKTKARVQGFVEAGRMTQDEADSVILSELHDQYRVKYQKEIANRKAEMSLKELKVTSNNLNMQQQQNEQFRQRNDKMKKACHHLQASAQ